MASDTMNRKQRKELARRLQSANPGLEVVHSRAAGIDVGNTAHYVAVRPDQDPEPVRRFEWSSDDCHAVDWRVLDSTVRDFGRTWFRSLSGERTAHQESARAQERCARKPMVAEAAYLRSTQQLLPANSGNPCGTDVLAATGRACARSVYLHPTNAEGADSDEPA